MYKRLDNISHLTWSGKKFYDSDENIVLQASPQY